MISVVVNGEVHKVDADPDTPLLWVLRDHLGLTGAKYGCGAGLCGACTVMMDGQPVRSCRTAVGDIEGRRIVTIEGMRGRVIDALRAAWIALDVPQCGYCQSGQLISAAALLAANPRPSDADIDRAMDGNLCRCGTYRRIRAGIHRAAATLAGAAP
ncbi:MAG: (2Fe-2S)-binding protein [Magnetospirillum sp.]|nr:(2Fe-2S)-binding protein [Magnetospirillum sp.]